jgi:hypothetical protein
MTAIAPATGHHGREGSTKRASAPVPWRRIAWVTWRQHRTALAAILLVMALAAVALLLTGLPMHEAAARLGPGWQDRTWLGPRVYVSLSVVVLLQLVPALAGIFLGAPLLAREAENGTSRLAWTQGASRSKWFVAQAAPVVVLLPIAAAGLARELSWWMSPLGTGYAPLAARFIVSPWGFRSSGSWGPELFDLHPLPFAGWVTMGFSLGVFLGAVIRRTVPTMAATIACYAVLLYETSTSWRMAYLAPLHAAVPHAQIGPGAGYGYGVPLRGGRGPDRNILSTALGWPDGRLLGNSQLRHPTAWFSQHHIRVWMTYQPASRYYTFQFIEFGWLMALSLLLIAATAILIRRRAA